MEPNSGVMAEIQKDPASAPVRWRRWVLLSILAIVLALFAGGFLAWKGWATLAKVPPSMSVAVAKDATGYTADVDVWNMSMQTARNLRINYAKWSGVHPDGRTFPIKLGDVGALQHARVSLHFTHPAPARPGQGELFLGCIADTDRMPVRTDMIHFVSMP